MEITSPCLLPLGDAQAEFLLLARWPLHELARERDLIRLFQQEGRHFPALAEYGQRINDRGYRNATDWMRRLVEKTAGCPTSTTRRSRSSSSAP